MAVQTITSPASNIFNGQAQKNTSRSNPGTASTSFSDLLKQSLNSVNQQQNDSDALVTKLANGGNVDLYQVMVATQKANISLQAALEVRNKAVEGYQEMMRMQV